MPAQMTSQAKEIYKINREIINKEKYRLIAEAKCNSIEGYFEKVKLILKNKSYNLNTIKEEEYKIIKLFQKMISFKIIEKNKYHLIQK